jgi:hypothetical protein
MRDEAVDQRLRQLVYKLLLDTSLEQAPLEEICEFGSLGKVQLQGRASAVHALQELLQQLIQVLRVRLLGTLDRRPREALQNKIVG